MAKLGTKMGSHHIQIPEFTPRKKDRPECGTHRILTVQLDGQAPIETTKSEVTRLRDVSSVARKLLLDGMGIDELM